MRIILQGFCNGKYKCITETKLLIRPLHCQTALVKIANQTVTDYSNSQKDKKLRIITFLNDDIILIIEQFVRSQYKIISSTL
jgi:hypothetical protein